MTPRNGSTSKAAKPAKAAPAKAAAKSAKAAPKAAPAKAAAKPKAVVKAVAPAPKPASPAPRATAPVPVNKVAKKDHKHFEERLLEERARLMKELGYLEQNVLKQNQRDSSGDLSGYSFHMADVGTDAMEREKAFLLASSEGRLLMEINEALRKLYAGEYGRCEICEKPIARARLEAMPYARLCLSCKEKEEKERRGAS